MKTETAKSHVMMYGDATIDAEVVSNFQGTTDSAAATKGAARQLFEAPKPKHASTDLKSADAEIASAFSRFMNLDFAKLGWLQCFCDKFLHIWIPVDNIHLFIVQFSHDVFDSLAA